jgi:hypothetical protein
MQRLKNLTHESVSVFQICVKRSSNIWGMKGSVELKCHYGIIGDIVDPQKTEPYLIIVFN